MAASSLSATPPRTASRHHPAQSQLAGFSAGQYTQLTVEIDGVRHTRCYSMANSALETNTIELTIKAHPDGLVSRHLVAHAAVGDVVGLAPRR